MGAQVRKRSALSAVALSAATGRAIHAMERTARRSPEVVVRITGRQNGGGHILANFAYISRLGHGDDVQVPLYTSDGDVLRDGKDMQVLAQDWQEWVVARTGAIRRFRWSFRCLPRPIPRR
jgi:hypothetical protein